MEAHKTVPAAPGVLFTEDGSGAQAMIRFQKSERRSGEYKAQITVITVSIHKMHTEGLDFNC